MQNFNLNEMLKFSIAIYLLSFTICVLGEFNLTIVHISDFHSHWFEYDENKNDCSEEESNEGKCFGGFPRLLTFIRDIRKKEKNVLVLSSGEFFLGRSLYAVHGWKFAHSLLPRLELDAMSLSNHDFDSGLYELSVFLYSMKFPILCANMWARNTTLIYSRVNKSAVVEVGGKKIGIVGYIHQHALNKSKSAVSVKFLPEIPALKKEVQRLESEGIDKIIALGHAGYYTDLKIAKEVKGVDIVIGGDSDIMLFDPGQDADESKKVGNIHGNYPRIHHHQPETEVENDTNLANRTLVLHIPQHGMYVGVLRVTFDDQGKIIHESGEPVLLDKRIPQDKDTLEFMKFGKKALENITEHKRLPQRDEVIGEALNHLEGNPRICRMRECTLGNFLADAILHEFTFHFRNNSEHRYQMEQWGPIDAVVFNSGPILRSIEPGFITLQHIVKSVFLGGFIKRVYMSGQHLLDMMEHSVRNYDLRGVTPPGAFLQIAGLKVEYDLNQNPGSRVKNLTIRCRDCGNDNLYFPVKQFKTYVIGMPTFLRDGRDGFYDFEEIDYEDFGQFDALLIVEYLQRVYYIEPKLDGRIKFHNFKDKDSEKEPISSADALEKEPFTIYDLPADAKSNSSLNESSTTVFHISNNTLSVEENESLMNASLTSVMGFKKAVTGNKYISSTLFKTELSPTSVELKNISISAENRTLLPTAGLGVSAGEMVEENGHINEQDSRNGTLVNNTNPLYKETPEDLISNEIIQEDTHHVTSKFETRDFNELAENKFGENSRQNLKVTENSSSVIQHLTPEAKGKNISSIFSEGDSKIDNTLKASDTFKGILISSQEKSVLRKVQKETPNLLEDENILDNDSSLSDNTIVKRSIDEKEKLKIEQNKTLDSPESNFFSSVKSVVHKTFMNMFTTSDSQLDGSVTSGSSNPTINDDSKGVASDEKKKPTDSVDATDQTSNVTPRTFTEDLVKWISSVSHVSLQGKASLLSEKMDEARSLFEKMYHYINKNRNVSLPNFI